MRLSRPLALVLLLAFARAGAAWGQCDTPLVLTEVRIEASLLVDKFGEKRHDIARRVARDLAGRMAWEFPYLCWAPAHAAAAQPAKGRLVLSLVDRRGAVVMRFISGVGPNGPLTAWPRFPDLPLYPNMHPGPDAKSEELRTDVGDHLDTGLTDALVQKMEGFFVFKVPMARQVEVREVERILVPIDEVPLRAGKDTRLRIDFKPDAAKPDEEGAVMLKKELPCRAGRKGLLTFVDTFTHTGVRGQRSGWDRRLPGWLKAGMENQTLEVFLEEIRSDTCFGDTARGIVQVHGGAGDSRCPICSQPAP